VDSALLDGQVDAVERADVGTTVAALVEASQPLDIDGGH